MLGEHYEFMGLGLLAAFCALPALPAMFFLRGWVHAWYDPDRRPAAARRLLLAMVFGGAVYLGALSWGLWVEPNWPQSSRVKLKGPFAPPLRILHLSDLHLGADTPRRVQWMLERTKELAPDLILLTGDLHQRGKEEALAAAAVLTQLKAPLGVFTCIGADDARLLEKAAPEMRILRNKTVLLNFAGKTIALAGLHPKGSHAPVYAEMAGADYKIVLNHYPDYAEEASRHGADLYLCGHTHGGQVRLPWWGAVFTQTATAKGLEAGQYQLGNTTVYTSRGVGMVPPPAPQVRFLCRPEIGLFTIGGEGQGRPVPAL
jgi:predicted MPP superfamily phosphohydrolase